jgi:hypothetical protein
VSETPTSFAIARAAYGRFFRELLEKNEPVTAENVFELEDALVGAEIEAAKMAVHVAGPPVYLPGDRSFVQQDSSTCMSTSLANALITFDEPWFKEETSRRVHEFTDHVVGNTSAFGKPGDYRSVDDLFKYLEAGRLKELPFAGDYRVRLTNSLLDVCEALWTGVARLVVQRRAHARLAYGLLLDDEAETLVMMRDPMASDGPGHELVTLDTLRAEFLWSPLKKIPRLMGPHAFEQLSAEELIGHLERYDGMDNLGVDCCSALVYRAADAPPVKTPPPPEEPAAKSEAPAEKSGAPGEKKDLG